MPLAEAPWGALVVESVLDRLEVSGIRSETTRPRKTPCGASGRTTRWTPSRSSAIRRRCSRAARSRSSGRTPTNDDKPEISLDSSEQMVVQYAEGSRAGSASPRRGAGATTTAASTRRCTCRTASTSSARPKRGRRPAVGKRLEWVPRIVLDADKQPEPWPLDNPFKRGAGRRDRRQPAAEAGRVGSRARRVRARPRRHRPHQPADVPRPGRGLLAGLPAARRDRRRSSATTTTTRWRRSTPTRARSRSSRIPRPRRSSSRPPTATTSRSTRALAARGDHEDAAPLLPARAGDGEPLRRRDPRRRGRLAAKVTDHKASLGEGWEEVLRLSRTHVADRRSTSGRAPSWSGRTTSRGRSPSAPTRP
jgi:hypothetical protein